jgi:hypothetical protein
MRIRRCWTKSLAKWKAPNHTRYPQKKAIKKMRLYNGIPAPTAVGNLPQNACAANTTVADVVNVPGARVGDNVLVTPESAVDLGLAFTSGYVSAAGVVTVYAMNTTAGALPAGAPGLNYRVLVLPRD